MELREIRKLLNSRSKESRTLDDKLREELIVFLESDCHRSVHDYSSKEMFEALTCLVIPYSCYTDMELVESFNQQLKNYEWNLDYKPNVWFNEFTVGQMIEKLQFLKESKL